MKTEKTFITVMTRINAPIEKIWEFWTNPEHIINWNFASDTWKCPWAKNDVQNGGKFVWRMEAKDGSFGFDFSGTYTNVKQNELIEETLDDGRIVKIVFSKDGNNTTVTETFEAEGQNSLDMQKTGWQAILDNFKKYAEKPGRLERLHFETEIDASSENVYRIMLGEDTYSEWTSVFNPTSYFKGTWQKGTKMLFLGTDNAGGTGGMVSRIKENIPGEFVSIEHIGFVKDNKEITSGAEVEEWSGAHENYSFKTADGKTLLAVDMDSNEKYKEYFSESWPKALEKLKEICESK